MFTWYSLMKVKVPAVLFVIFFKCQIAKPKEYYMPGFIQKISMSYHFHTQHSTVRACCVHCSFYCSVIFHFTFNSTVNIRAVPQQLYNYKTIFTFSLHTIIKQIKMFLITLTVSVTWIFVNYKQLKRLVHPKTKILPQSNLNTHRLCVYLWNKN